VNIADKRYEAAYSCLLKLEIMRHRQNWKRYIRIEENIKEIQRERQIYTGDMLLTYRPYGATFL